jgi:D-amino-acid oxidase
VGLRPARRSGLRLERGEDILLIAPSVEWGSEIEAPVHVPTVYNIGHAGAGWQCSWGCAEKVVGIIKEIIAQ